MSNVIEYTPSKVNVDFSSSCLTEEFNALSEVEQNEQWEDFHSKCAEGTADNMYFYDVLMSQWLVGYVGH